MNRSPRKRVGLGGYLRLRLPGRTAAEEQRYGLVEFIPSGFSDSKPEIERRAAESFASARVPGMRITSLTQLVEDDFDFVAQTERGERYLELMEFVPIPPTALVEEASSHKYSPWEYSRWILENVLRKSAKYRGATRVPIVLLIYTTRWQFTTPDVGILTRLLERESHCFEGIYFHAVDAVTLVLCPPIADFWNTFDPMKHALRRDADESMRRAPAWVFNPTTARSIPGGVTFSL